MNRNKLLFLLFMLLIAIPTQSLKAAEKEGAVTVSAGKGGFTITSADGDFQLRIRAYIQADGRFFLNDNVAAIDTFVLRRVRPVFEGTVYKYFDFKIMPDFGLGTTVLQDAYLDARFSPAFKVRFGKGKTPFGLERLQSATDLVFIERSLATNLVPNRDLGIYLFGDVAGDKVSYAAGIFNGVVDLGSSDSDLGNEKDFAGRIFVRPLSGLGVGLAITTGEQNGTLLAPNLPVYRTQGQLAWFRYRIGLSQETTTIAAGTRFRYSPQMTYYNGPFGLLAEYVSSSQEVANGHDNAEIENRAWNVTAHYVLTGEQASYKGVTPRNDFDPESGKFGAWEVAFRYSQLNIDDDAFPLYADPVTAARRAKNWSAGLNWYLNKNVKFVLNYDQTDFSGAPLKTEKLFSTRAQIAW